jgi:hypothetical protein
MIAKSGDYGDYYRIVSSQTLSLTLPQRGRDETTSA